MDITRRAFIKALALLAGAPVAAQLDKRLEAMARTLNGPQEWVLMFDDDGLERLCRERVKFGKGRTEGKSIVMECSLDVSESDLWALATLTDPDGAEWRTVDGENWTEGDRRMIL